MGSNVTACGCTLLSQQQGSPNKICGKRRHKHALKLQSFPTTPEEKGRISLNSFPL